MRTAILAFALAWCDGSITSAHAQPISWLRQRDVAAALAQEVSITWSGVPLRDALYRLAGTHRMAIVLDRRVDPGQRITAQMSKVTLEDALGRLTSTRQLGFTILGSVIYVGPPRVAARLRTVAASRRQEANSLPRAARMAFLDRAAWEWSDFSVPKDLLAELAHEGGVRLEGVDSIPHDLWAETFLPPLSLIDRMTLVAIQLDLSFRFSADGRTLTLVAVAENPTIEKRYPAGRDPRARLQRFRALIPDAQIKTLDGRIVVRGRIEEHERLTASVRSRSLPKKPERGEEVYQLNLKNVPVGKVVKELGQRLGLDIRTDEAGIRAADLSLDKLISVHIKDATLDELLEAVLKPAELAFRRKGTRIDVEPRANR